MRPASLLMVLALVNYVDSASLPHIIFIVADDLGWNDIGYHNPDMYTPNLDALASKGVTLNSSYVQPLCAPSRSAFLSGYYPFHTGLQHAAIKPQQPKYLSTNFTLLPEKLKGAGYATHIVGKWHLGFCNVDLTPTRRGFDTFMGFLGGSEDYFTHKHENGYDFRYNEAVYHPTPGEYSTHIFRDRALEILESVDPNTEPLFLYLPFQAAHGPIQVPDSYLKNCMNFTDTDRRKFCGMVAALDEAVGNITDALHNRGFMQNALVIFTTDNGGSIHNSGNNLPLRGSKATIWEGGTRGVGFVYSDNLFSKTGYVNTEIIHAVDWFPTILALANITDDNGIDIDGVNQWDMLSNGGPSARDELVYNIDNLASRAGIRVGKYKLIEGGAGNNNGWIPVPPEADTYVDVHLPKYQLFDLENDPTEHNNIADDFPDIVQQLKHRIERHRQTMIPAKSVKNVAAGNPNRFNGVWSPGWC